MNYFESLPTADKTLANLKAKFIEKWTKRNRKEAPRSSNKKKYSFEILNCEDKAAFAANRYDDKRNLNDNVRNPSNRGNRFYKDRGNFSNRFNNRGHADSNKNNHFNNKRSNNYKYNNSRSNNNNDQNNSSFYEQNRKCFSCGKEGH